MNPQTSCESPESRNSSPDFTEELLSKCWTSTTTSSFSPGGFQRDPSWQFHDPHWTCHGTGFSPPDDGRMVKPSPISFVTLEWDEWSWLKHVFHNRTWLFYLLLAHIHCDCVALYSSPIIVAPIRTFAWFLYPDFLRVDFPSLLDNQG